MNIFAIKPSTYFELNPIENPYRYLYPTLKQFIDAIKITVMVEVYLLLVGLLVILIIQFFVSKKKAISKDEENQYKKELLGSASSLSPFSIDQVSNWPITLLLGAMEYVDTLIISDNWNTIKQQISQELLLPMARSLATHRYWLKRVIAARCFAFCPTAQDQNLILNLLHDPIPMVQYLAIASASHLGTDESIEAIIDAMSSETRFARFPLRDALRSCDAKTFAYVEQKLNQPISTYQAVSCLEVLNARIYHNIYSTLENKLSEPNKNLQLAVIRILGNYPTEPSIMRLIKLLDSSEWEIRAIAASALGQPGRAAAIPTLIKLLRDKVWWVRMNAAIALKKIGGDGIKALTLQDPDIDKFANDVAQFVLAH